MRDELDKICISGWRIAERGTQPNDFAEGEGV